MENGLLICGGDFANLLPLMPALSKIMHTDSAAGDDIGETLMLNSRVFKRLLKFLKQCTEGEFSMVEGVVWATDVLEGGAKWLNKEGRSEAARETAALMEKGEGVAGMYLVRAFFGVCGRSKDVGLSDEVSGSGGGSAMSGSGSAMSERASCAERVARSERLRNLYCLARRAKLAAQNVLFYSLARRSLNLTPLLSNQASLAAHPLTLTLASLAGRQEGEGRLRGGVQPALFGRDRGGRARRKLCRSLLQAGVRRRQGGAVRVGLQELDAVLRNAGAFAAASIAELKEVKQVN